LWHQLNTILELWTVIRYMNNLTLKEIKLNEAELTKQLRDELKNELTSTKNKRERSLLKQYISLLELEV